MIWIFCIRYRFTVEFVGEFFLNRWTFGEATGKKIDCLTCSVRLGTVLLKDKELAINLTYDMKKLLLNVVTLVSPLILTLVVTNIDLIRPILTDWQTPSVTNQPLVGSKAFYCNIFFWIAEDAYTVGHTVGFLVWPLCMFCQWIK